MLPNQVRSAVTIYNLSTDSKNLPVISAPVILDGVYQNNSYGLRLKAEAVQSDDKVLLIIPLSISVSGRDYIDAFLYTRLPDAERSNYWTLAKGDKIINKAVEQEFNRATDIEKAFGFDNVYTISEVVTNNFGSPSLQHYMVTGR